MRRHLVVEHRLEAKGRSSRRSAPTRPSWAWAEGADLIVGHRLRHGITSFEDDPLGPRVGDADRRRERQEAERRPEEVRQRLGHERVQTPQRTIELEI